jgi:hypothetical protein
MTSRVEVGRTRGTTADNNAYTGPEGMITVVTDHWGEVRVHDGVTPGGYPIGLGAAPGTSPIPDGDVIANISGGSAVPAGNTVSAVLDHVFGNAQGMILYRGASAWAALAHGTSGQFLETQGAAANPQWANGNAGTITSIIAGTGLTGGTITSSGTIALAIPVSVADGGTGDTSLTAHAVLLGEGTSAVAFATIGTANRVLADNGSGADPSFTTITALLDAAFGSAQGDILYRNASAWVVLAPGTSGYLLQTQGAAANPQWAAASAAAADSVTTSVAAAGSNQSGATALTTQQNYVSTSVDGTHGVRIDASLMTVGGHVFVTNEDTSHSLPVYPDSGIAINSLSANAAITVPADTTAHFIVKSSTALRSVP